MNGALSIIGNFAKPRRYKNGKPKDWIHRDYKAIVPYDLKWRHKTKRHTCTCKEMIEAYQPYYGFTWYHSKECDFAKKHYLNPVIAQSE